MHRYLRTCALLVLMCGSASAQQAGVHRGLFLGFLGWGSPPVSAVGQVSPLNQWTAWPTRPSGPWAYWGDVLSATQDVDNIGVIVPASHGYSGSKPVRVALLVWDPGARAVARTLWQGKYGAAGTPQALTNTTLNSDGNVFSYDSALDRYCELDRLTGAWTSAPGRHQGGAGGLGGVEWDKLRGGYLIATTSVLELGLYRLSWNLKSSSLIASAFGNIVAQYGGGMLENGEWVSSSARLGSYVVMRPSTGRWEHGPMTSWGVFSDCTPERYAAPGRGYYAAFSGWWSMANHGIAHVDATTSPHTITGLVGGPYPNQVWSPAVTEVLPLHQRDLCTVRTGKASWNVIVNPAQSALAGRPFRLVASLAGATPPTRLKDGREFFLVPDALTQLTAAGPIPPLLTGNTGHLNTKGLAVAKLSLSSFGTGANGTVIHFGALVLDPLAPSGVAWVCEPWAFVVNVRP